MIIPNNTNLSGPVGWPPRGPPVLPPEAQEIATLEKELRPMFYTFAYASLILALLGNGLIILIVAYDRQNRSMANLFMFNISIADVLFAVLNIAGESAYLSMEDTPGKIFVDYACLFKSLISSRILTYAVSMLSLAALSVERYHAVCKPLTTYTNAANINIFKKGIFVFIWVMSIAMSVPVGLCKFEVEANVKAFAVSLVVMLHSIPLFIIVVTNTIIVVSLRSRVGPGENREAGEGRARRKRLTTLLIVMVVTFIIFWSPYQFFFLRTIFVTQSQHHPVYYFRMLIVQRAAGVLAYFNPTLNPFLYMFYSKNFRQGLCKLIRRNTEYNLTKSAFRTRAGTSRQTAATGDKMSVELNGVMQRVS